jgi:hypothetical protein
MSPRGATERAFACTACTKTYLFVSGSAKAPSTCSCGAPLRHAPLPAGTYEIVVHAQDTVTAPIAREPTAPELSPPQERDLGYGESHGNAPGHGGPTGPGDAPARPSPASTTKTDAQNRSDNPDR